MVLRARCLIRPRTACTRKKRSCAGSWRRVMNVTGERTILADCCEDWIIEWGGFYRAGRDFRCPECATEWKKTEADAYRRGDGRSFVRRARTGPNAEFPYLAAADGDRKSTRLNSSHERLSRMP